MKFFPGGGGWVWCRHERGDELVGSIRFGLADNDRLVIREVHVAARQPGTQPITAALLRDFPLNEAEAAANGPDLRDDLIARLDEDVRIEWKNRSETDREFPTKLGARPTGKLPVPKGNRYPDAFYRRTAREYARLVTSGDRAPAQTIAEANGVPATTAHRWIKEARRRGFLPAGRAGRAG